VPGDDRPDRRPPTLAELRTAAIDSLFAAGLDVHASRMDPGNREATRRAGERAAHLADTTGLAVYAVAYQAVLRLATAELHGAELERAVAKDRAGKARRGWVPTVSTERAKTTAVSSVVTADATKPRERMTPPLPAPSKAHGFNSATPRRAVSTGGDVGPPIPAKRQRFQTNSPVT
jgi:hypothetical protein